MSGFQGKFCYAGEDGIVTELGEIAEFPDLGEPDGFPDFQALVDPEPIECELEMSDADLWRIFGIGRKYGRWTNAPYRMLRRDTTTQ